MFNEEDTINKILYEQNFVNMQFRAEEKKTHIFNANTKKRW